MKKLLTLFLLIILCGCSTVHKMYSGPDLPASETATVRGADVTINLVSCDGNKFSANSIIVLPGKHIVEMSFYDSVAARYSNDTAFLQFDAEKGHNYIVDKKLNTGYSRYSAFIMDAASGKTVSTNIVKPGGEKERLVVVEKSLKEHPREANFWIEKGDLLVKMKRYNEALPCLETALSLKPDQNGNFWNLKSFVLYQLKRYDEALADIDKAIKIRGNDNDKKGRETVLKAMGAK
jgi:tetratricopeptide (TPR) repeat protein